MAYDPVRFLVVRDFLRFPRSFHWQDRLPDQLKTVKDRRFYCHLLQGMIRHRRLLQTEVCNRVDKPFHKLQKSLVGILALGIYQLLFMNRIPTRASIYESVALAHPFRIIAQKSLINAVLRNLASDLENNYSYHHHSLAIRTSHQDWMVARWQAFYAPAQVESICTANNIFEGVTIRAMPPGSGKVSWNAWKKKASPRVCIQSPPRPWSLKTRRICFTPPHFNKAHAMYRTALLKFFWIVPHLFGRETYWTSAQLLEGNPSGFYKLLTGKTSFSMTALQNV